MKQVLLLALFLSNITFLFGQAVLGNVAYSDSYRNNGKNSEDNTNYIAISDSAIVFSAKILLNTYADEYVLTYGLDKTGATPKIASDNINKQVNDFQNLLKKEGILENEMYVDFISQTKVYDYKVAGNIATQFLSGFLVKKNVVIQLKDIKKFEKVFEIAATLGIYDLVAVKHIISDKQRVYNQLVKEAMLVIDNKKRQYSNFTSVKLIKDSIPYSESFYAVYPENNYKSFEAFESSSVDYGSDMVKKDLNKKSTYYFEGVSVSTFDKVIDEGNPRKEIQYILELKIKYLIK